MVEELGRLRIEVEGFGFDIVYFSNGAKVATVEDLIRLKAMCATGSLPKDKAMMVVKEMQRLTFNK